MREGMAYSPLRPRGGTAQLDTAHRFGALAAAGLATMLVLAVLASTASSWRGGAPAPRLGRLVAAFDTGVPLDAPAPAAAAPAAAAAAGPGRFMTNAAIVKKFKWEPPNRTLQAAAHLAFPGGDGWQDIAFAEGTGGSWTLQAVVNWVDQELLNGPDPFAEDGPGSVPLPYTAPKSQGGKFPTPRDQLEPGQWVAYSRRQVCFIVAKSFVGAKTTGYENGLERFMFKHVGGVPTNCMPASGDFGRAWWTLLASCAADPGLAAGGQGPVLVAAKALDEPKMSEVRDYADSTPLSGAGLRTCSYDDGTDAAAGLGGGLGHVPAEGCRQPSSTGPGADFMTGGLQGQATQDISANFLGGYVYGNTCNLGGGQDERLMIYYPEVSALTFFLSEAGPDGIYGPPQLRQPAWILGARRMRSGIDGTCFFENTFQVDPHVPLTSDLIDVRLADASLKMSGSNPFLAFMSENQGFLGWPEPADALRRARTNKEPKQRDVDPASTMSFEKQVRAWYRAVALPSYDKDVQPVLKAVVTSLGVGPWGAGLWWGDSQVSLLASWIGHAMAAQTWDGQPLPLDYYLYSAFTENPGNQCLVHSSGQCQACMQRCTKAAAGQQHAFWMPGAGFREVGNPDPCATTAADCGQHGLGDVAQQFGQQTAGALWKAVERSLAGTAGQPVTSSVFDILLSAPAAVAK
mmetsp:Transcript_168117/g.534927  ORF Transcript_168117/g.534927 Transcript_168117/m.534927 type:complete len:687 (-) Transcript_168117:80-2140(-)